MLLVCPPAAATLLWSRAALVLHQTFLVPCVWWWDPGPGLSGSWPAAPRQTAREGTPGPQEAERPTSSWDLLPYLAHWASLPLFCFRPPSPCPRAAAMPYGAEARLLRCCWCLLVNVDTLAYTATLSPGQLVPGHHWPSQALAPATCLACSFVLTTDQLSRFCWLPCRSLPR